MKYSRTIGRFKFMWFPNSCFYVDRIDRGSIVWLISFWRFRINVNR